MGEDEVFVGRVWGLSAMHAEFVGEAVSERDGACRAT
jgi:hypothetical protein